VKYFLGLVGARKLTATRSAAGCRAAGRPLRAGTKKDAAKLMKMMGNDGAVLESANSAIFGGFRIQKLGGFWGVLECRKFWTVLENSK